MRDGSAALLRYRELRSTGGEGEIPAALPQDTPELICLLVLACDGVEVDLPNSGIAVFDAEDIADVKDEVRITDDIPGAFVFGGTDLQYLFTVDGGPVYSADRGWLELDEGKRLADDLDDFVDKVLAGTLAEVL